MSLKETAATGKRLETLQALRDHLAQAIDACDSMRDLAALSRQFADVLQQIDALAEPEKKGDAVDEIAQRRAARRSGPAKSPARAKSSS